jgi:hypothetical protein
MPKKRAQRELEADVKKSVQEVLDDFGWFWWMPPSNTYGKVGISDIHAVKDHIFMVIETKRGKADPKPTPNQIAFLQQIRGQGHFAFVVNEPRILVLRQFLAAFSEAQKAVQAKQMPVAATGATMLDAIRIMQQEI